MERITQTPQFIAQAIIDPTRVDFDVRRYEEIISQKGVVVMIEKSIMCPCKTQSSSNQSTCKNCGGSGWIFTTAKETRMVIQGMGLSTDYKPWSEELKGMVKLSASATEELSFMDKITHLNAESIFSEVIYVDGLNEGENSTLMGYKPKEILYAAKFNSISTPLSLLVENVDYSIVNNTFTLLSHTQETDISITLRYKHAPVYHITDFNRENMQSFVFTNKEELSNMPISAVARRAHYIPNMENISNNRLVINPWPIQTKCN